MVHFLQLVIYTVPTVRLFILYPVSNGIRVYCNNRLVNPVLLVNEQVWWAAMALLSQLTEHLPNVSNRPDRSTSIAATPGYYFLRDLISIRLRIVGFQFVLW
jgi:hypothetical protein